MKLAHVVVALVAPSITAGKWDGGRAEAQRVPGGRVRLPG